MSGLSNIPIFTPADYQDDDTYGENCTAEMLARETTIATATLDTVSRNDGVQVTANDIQISDVSVLPGGLKYAWRAAGGVRGVIYYIRFRLTLASGDVINRTVAIPVPQYVG